jgi:hypothetical protein
MTKKYTLLLLLCFGLLLTAYGCAALVAGGAAAGGTYAYTEGWVGRDYQVGLDRAYDMSLQAAQKLDMSVVERDKDVASARIKARKSDTDYWIKLDEKGEGLTNVSVRAGIIGDKEASQKIHHEIETLVAAAGRRPAEPRAQLETPERTSRTGAAATATRTPGKPAAVEPQTRPEPARTGQTETMQPTEKSMQLRYSNVDADNAQDWVGQKLIGQNDQELGTVNSLYSPEGKRVLYVIVEGDAGRLHPIPAQMIREDAQNNRLTAQIDKERFDQSPNFSGSERPQLEEQRWSEEIRSFYEAKK